MFCWSDQSASHPVLNSRNDTIRYENSQQQHRFYFIKLILHDVGYSKLRKMYMKCQISLAYLPLIKAKIERPSSIWPASDEWNEKTVVMDTGSLQTFRTQTQ